MNRLKVFFILPLLFTAFLLKADDMNNQIQKTNSEGHFSSPEEVTLIEPETMSAVEKTQAVHSLDLREVFSAAPIIYTILLAMSVTALVIWLYSLYNFRPKRLLSQSLIQELRKQLKSKDYDLAIDYCENQKDILSQIIISGLSSRQHGPQFMTDRMKVEGKRLSARFWQRISLLNDIVIIAPMLGLLGTVIGLFYAFYDVNRSLESINSLFDGLGIAVGTTVGGLIVAILAMVFHTTLKHRLIKMLGLVENEALSLGSLIEKDG